MAKTPQEETDDLMLAVGYGLRAWAGVEDAITMLFIQAAKTDLDAIAATIISSIVSFEAKLKVCSAVMRHRLAKDAELPVWDKLAARTIKFYSKRHELAHFDLMTETTVLNGVQQNTVRFHPYGNYASFISGNPKTLTVEQIHERTSKFNEIKDAVIYFWTKLVRQGHEIEVPERVPDLIHRLRTLADQTHEEPSPPPRSSRA